ncbi:hypothetical protein ABZ769_11390 [Streptomyces olivoreticuli]
MHEQYERARREKELRELEAQLHQEWAASHPEASVELEDDSKRIDIDIDKNEGHIS